MQNRMRFGYFGAGEPLLSNNFSEVRIMRIILTSIRSQLIIFPPSVSGFYKGDSRWSVEIQKLEHDSTASTDA
jgi:hypothetical protein